MATKYKIVAGFALMILLAAAIAFIGYGSLRTSLGLMGQYQRVSTFDVYMSELEKELYATVYTLERFMASRNTDFIKSAATDINDAQALVHAGIPMVSTAERRQTLQAAEQALQYSQELLTRIQINTLAAYAQYKDICLPNTVVMTGVLRTVYTTGRRTGNTEALFYASQMLENMLNAGINMASYAEGRSKEDAQLAHDNLQSMAQALAGMKSVMTSEAGVRDYAQLAGAFAKLQEGFGQLVTLNETAAKDISKLREDFTALLNTVVNLNKTAAAASRSFADEANAKGASSQTQLLIVSVVATLIGIILAVAIILGLVKTLSGMATYLNRVAAGDFHNSYQVKEKGEIGVMFQSIQKIPVILADIIGKCDNLANTIASGRFRERLQHEEFQGEFSSLARAVNVVGDSYTAVLDSLPVGLMTINEKMNVQFLNKQATAMTGKTAGENCRGAFGDKSCNSDKCFGRCSMDESKSIEGEVSFRPGGVRRDLSVTGVPLQDMSRKVVGSMEILSDITEIRTQQDTMLQVAQQAAEISDRVAAAAEELSAQVEQVSRGAEMQRERVEATASAMTQMNSTVLEVARSAGQASEQSEETRRNAQSGSGLVNQVVQAINDVNKIAAKLQENMNELGSQAESIGGVMNVISDIADQTNLLALNAAIEAARAGEAGRGFAVVADEVRKLAEKTMDATKEVGDNITAIQASAKHNIGEVSVAAENVTRATALANSSGESLGGIVSLATATSGVVAAIATAAEEQSATSEEITRAIDEISRVTAESAEGMVQASSAIQDLSITAQELRKVMERLA